jgi:hypothetical protein
MRGVVRGVGVRKKMTVRIMGMDTLLEIKMMEAVDQREFVLGYRVEIKVRELKSSHTMYEHFTLFIDVCCPL